MIFLFLHLQDLAHAESYRPPPRTGVIIAVYDGDTFTLDNGDKIRLRGANTPELRPKEAFGIEARDSVKDLILNQKVTLTYGSVERDGYGRLIASVQYHESSHLSTHSDTLQAYSHHHHQMSFYRHAI